MKDTGTRWFVSDEGMKVWRHGELVATIHKSDFKYVLSDLALWLRHNNGESSDNG